MKLPNSWQLRTSQHVQFMLTSIYDRWKFAYRMPCHTSINNYHLVRLCLGWRNFIHVVNQFGMKNCNFVHHLSKNGNGYGLFSFIIGCDGENDKISSRRKSIPIQRHKKCHLILWETISTKFNNLFFRFLVIWAFRIASNPPYAIVCLRPISIKVNFLKQITKKEVKWGYLPH